jgi:hypothetical protein
VERGKQLEAERRARLSEIDHAGKIAKAASLIWIKCESDMPLGSRARRRRQTLSSLPFLACARQEQPVRAAWKNIRDPDDLDESTHKLLEASRERLAREIVEARNPACGCIAVPPGARTGVLSFGTALWDVP